VQFVVHIENVHVDVFGYIAERYSCCCSSFEHVILVPELMYLKLQKGGPYDKGIVSPAMRKPFGVVFIR